MISRRASRLRPTAVNSVLAEVRALQGKGATLVSLMRGEPDFSTPEHIADAAVAALRGGRTRYADNRGEPALRNAIAAKLSRDNRIEVDPAAEVLVTTGATLGIWAALAALLDDGDEVLVPDPVYDAYYSPILLAGGTPRPASSAIEADRFRLTAAVVDAACTPGTRALLLNTPWNPTGTVFTRDELSAIGDVVLRRGLWLISDEIYEAITYDGRVHVSPASLSSGLRARTILVNSLSKTYAMTGWRCGYCVAPAPMIQAMLLVLQQSSRGPATFIQDAAAAALTGPQDCVAAMRDEYTHRRARVSEALKDLRGVRVLAPEGGFFTMLDIRGLGRPSDEVRRFLLNEAGVVVIHGAAYGAAGEGTLRVSFGSGGATLDRGLELLRQGLSRITP